MRQSPATLLALSFQPGRAREPKRLTREFIRNVVSLFGPGGRKYMTSRERRRFRQAAEKVPAKVSGDRERAITEGEKRSVFIAMIYLEQMECDWD
jgi:hypothetical protein